MVETYCLAADVQLKSGSNAATLTAPQYTTLINQAEAWINNTMRKDYIALYAAGLNANTKLILNDLCSSKAAYINIAYNQDGTTTSEVTNLLNVNSQIIRDSIQLLKDQDVISGIQDGY